LLLEVEFLDGSVWQYSGVAEAVYQQFLTAGSKGSFYRQHIQGKFSGKKL
jgi:KTSC domain